MFPQEKKRELEDKESIFNFKKGRLGDIISHTDSGKTCFPDRCGKHQPNAGESWYCKIMKETEKSIILTLINKV